MMENTFVVTGKCRFSYVNVFQPRKTDDGSEPKYSLCLLIPKSDTKTVAKINAAIEAAKVRGQQKYGSAFPAKPKSPLKDGDGSKNNGDDYGPECAGHWVLNTSSKSKPGAVDRNREDILDPAELYSGCYGRASLNFYPFVVPSNKGIACGLQNVQKLDDGEPLGGGRTRAEDDFKDEWDDDDEI